MAETLYSQPVVAIGADGVALTDPAKHIAQLETGMKRLEETDWAKSVLRNPNVCVLTSTMALASGQWTRHKKDGSVHSQGAETIVFAKSKYGWKIVSLIGHDAGRIIPCVD